MININNYERKNKADLLVVGSSRMSKMWDFQVSMNPSSSDN
jgi:nucleotide-binding universal stress UspA family protein